MSETQGGSCESCKRKKCKCDRQLPTCGQCASSPQPCKYAENNKRGIPGGYLSALEQRLHETEIALYNALCELRKIKSESAFTDHPDLSEPLRSHQAATNKYSRMAEWIRYPLNRSDEVENWWNSVENHKLPENPIEEPVDLDAILHNEQSSTELPNVGTLPYQQIDQSVRETSNFEQSIDSVSFNLPSQQTRHTDQIFQENVRSQISTSEGHLNERRFSPQNNSGMELDALKYPDAENNMHAPQSQASSWNGSRVSGGLNLESGTERGTDMNRSKELTSRMRYKYY